VAALLEAMEKVLVICGPTGVGKTAVAIEVAERLEGEIVSADSRQIYRYLDIGTAKPTPEERQRIPHHLVDMADPDRQFTAADYGELARKAVRDIIERGKRPIVCGGSGLYLYALTEGFFEGPPADPEIREELEAVAARDGVGHLHQMLSELDPEAGERIGPHDKVRIVRALEVLRICGKPISLLQREGSYPAQEFEFVKVGLTQPRQELYKKIDERVDKMIEGGLLDEVRSLRERGYDPELVPLKTVGYQEIFDHLEGRFPLEKAIELIKRNTRRYAKRQLTWFRKDKEIRWHEVKTPGLVDRIVRAFGEV
jgi:tRNA dimethylallyltransferase